MVKQYDIILKGKWPDQWMWLPDQNALKNQWRVTTCLNNVTQQKLSLQSNFLVGCPFKRARFFVEVSSAWTVKSPHLVRIQVRCQCRANLIKEKSTIPECFLQIKHNRWQVWTVYRREKAGDGPIMELCWPMLKTVLEMKRQTETRHSYPFISAVKRRITARHRGNYEEFKRSISDVL
jgi:hypothetical protein